MYVSDQLLVTSRDGNRLLRLLRLAVNPPSQAAGRQIDQHGKQHHNHAKPDAPVAVRAFPIRPMAVVKFRAIGIFKPVVDWFYFIHGLLIFLIPSISNSESPASLLRAGRYNVCARSVCPASAVSGSRPWHPNGLAGFTDGFSSIS